MKKALLPTNDLYMQFTEEELQTLNMKPGDKFDCKIQADGSIKLDKYVKLELDMEEWPREVLEMIIKESCEQDVSANEIINDMLKGGLKLVERNADEEFFNDCTKSSYDWVSGRYVGLESMCGCSELDAVLPTASNSNYTTASGDML